MSQAPMPPAYIPQQPKSSGMAVASMVLGIIAVVLFCFWYVSIPCAILAIILGIVARNKAKRGEADGQGMATAGLVCGIISIALALLIILLAVIGFSFFGEELQKQIERQEQLQQQQQQSPPGTPSGPEQSLNWRLELR